MAGPLRYGWLGSLLLGMAPAGAATLKVPQSYATIQGAIDKALYGDRVLVSPGVYLERLTMRPGVSLEGAGTETQPVEIVGTGSGSVVSFIDVADLSFSGFQVSGAGAGSSDALLYLESSSPLLQANVFVDSPSVAVLAGSSSYPSIQGNRFQGNVRGVVVASGSDALISDNDFLGQTNVGIDVGERCFPEISGNRFQADDRSIYCRTGSAPSLTDNLLEGALADAITLDGASPGVTGNTIVGSSGAGLVLRNGAQPQVRENHFDGNVDGIVMSGGSPLLMRNWLTRNSNAAIVLYSLSYPTLLQNILQDNGDGLVLIGGSDGDVSPHLINNTIVTSRRSGIHLIDAAYPGLNNNIVAFNDEYGLLCEGTAQPTLAFNDVYGNTLDDFGGRCEATETDISQDPLFVALSDDDDPTNDDLHLQEGSPAINTGNPNPDYNDQNGSRNDMGAYGGPDHPSYVDMDGDGYTTDQGDCNDADPAIHPRALEVPDGVDNDCDGQIDESGSGDDDASGSGDDDASGSGDDDASGSGDDDASGGGDDDASGSGDDDASGSGDDDASGSGDDSSQNGEGCTCRVEGTEKQRGSSLPVTIGLLGLGAWRMRRRR